MSATTVFMFSGQGSQYFHMGSALYDGNPTFRAWMNRLDAMVRSWSCGSVVDSLYSEANRKGAPFDRTLLTHPAIFMVEYSLAQTLIDAGVEPDMVLGASLGSFAAAAVAGFISVEDALRAVVQQALAFESSCEPGGMIAVLENPALFAEDYLSGRSELAAVNFSSHFVISARQAELAEIEADLNKRNISHQRLPVSFPFHSQWIDRAHTPFASFMQSIGYKESRLPLVCCDLTEPSPLALEALSARPYAFLDDGSIAFIRCERGEERLFALAPGAGLLRDLNLPYTSFGFPSLSVRGTKVAFAAAGHDGSRLVMESGPPRPPRSGAA